MGRHAYLIMAHDQIELLCKQLECLDHERNDFFIHIDKRAKLDKTIITSSIKKGRIFFIRSTDVKWGGYSIIKVTLELLEEAIKKETYDYYHFMSGADFPLKPQDEILEYFDNSNQIQYISTGTNGGLSDVFLDRIKIYYPFQDLFKSRRNIFGKILRKSGSWIQKILKVNRLNGEDIIEVGSAFFDITDDFARYVVENKAYVQKHFKMGYCADEMFIQTLYINWKEKSNHKRYDSGKHAHPYIQDTYFDVNRAIDWVRGRPYTFDINDYEMLMDTGCLFARKFDYINKPQIVDKIYLTIKS